MSIRSIAGALACLAVSAFACPAHADVVVPAGARWVLGNGAMSLGGTDLLVAGEFVVVAGRVEAVDALVIAAGGRFDAGDGTLRIAGRWNNEGVFVPGTSAVEFVDGGAGSGSVGGSTSFFDASFASAVGRTWRFAVGSTQSFSGRLAIAGAPGQPIQIASSAAGQAAFFDLRPGGTQAIHDVGVSDVHAVGQPLAANQSNQGGTGNALGWFGAAVSAVLETIPSASAPMLGLLCALVLFVAVRSRRFGRLHFS